MPSALLPSGLHKKIEQTDHKKTSKYPRYLQICFDHKPNVCEETYVFIIFMFDVVFNI